MKKLLLLAAVGVVAYTLGKRAGIRNPSVGDAEQNAQRTMGPMLHSEGESVDALAAIAGFDERQVALAELALGREIGDDTRSLATLLLEEHNVSRERVRALSAAIGVAMDETMDLSIGDDASLLRLESLDSGTFETSWIAAVTDDHSRMLESIDDVLLPLVNDERVAEHLRLVRDDVHMHLQNAIALGGGGGAANAA